MGLLKSGSATRGVLFSTVIFLSGGMIGTFHHLYFSGTPTAVLALGASFSAMEVVPLVLIGFEVAHLFLRRGRLLEPRRRWPVRVLHQSSHRPLLHAGLEHHARSWPHRSVRRLRHARHRPHALLPARIDQPARLENRDPQVLVLVHQ